MDMAKRKHNNGALIKTCYGKTRIAKNVQQIKNRYTIKSYAKRSMIQSYKGDKGFLMH